MNVILYLRVSTEKQADKNLSVPSQLSRLHQYCEEKGHTILHEFVDDGISGTIEKRPALQKMMRFCELNPEVDLILVLMYSRFFRDYVSSGLHKRFLREHGVKVVSITQPIPEGVNAEMYEGMIELFDAQQPRLSAVGTIRGMTEVARQGFYPLSTAAYGYDRCPVGKGKQRRFRLAPNENEVALVRRMFEVYTQKGLGAKEIAKRLNADGLRTRKGKRWTTKAILRILRNPVYVGTLHIEFHSRFSDLVPESERVIHMEGAHEPIIDSSLFENTATLLQERAEASPKALGSDYLLSGLLRCDVCGSPYHGKSAKSGQYHYYECNRKIQSGPESCSSRAVNADRLNALVLEKTSEVLLEDDNIESLARQVNDELGDHEQIVANQLKVLEAEIRKRRTQISNLLDALEEACTEVPVVLERIAERKEELRVLEAERFALKSEDSVNIIQHVDTERVLPYVASLRTTLDAAPVKTRRFILKSFIKRISVGKSEITIEYSIPQDRTAKMVGARVLGTVTSGTLRSRIHQPMEDHQVDSVRLSLRQSGVLENRSERLLPQPAPHQRSSPDLCLHPGSIGEEDRFELGIAISGLYQRAETLSQPWIVGSSQCRQHPLAGLSINAAVLHQLEVGGDGAVLVVSLLLADEHGTSSYSYKAIQGRGHRSLTWHHKELLNDHRHHENPVPLASRNPNPLILVKVGSEMAHLTF